MIQGAFHHLTLEQILFLDRGPSYVSPCQIYHSLSKTNNPLDRALFKKVAPLRRQLTKLFTKYPVDRSRRMNFTKEVEQSFMDSFSVPIPTSLQERASYEYRLMQSIQYQLKRDKLILRRTADDKNTYFLADASEFNFREGEYMQYASCYEAIKFVDDNATVQDPIHRIIQAIDKILKDLQEKKLIPKEHLSKMLASKRSNPSLPYLYFLPDAHQNGQLGLRPRISSSDHSPIQPLATFLDQLIGPLYEKGSRSTTFLNNADFIQKLEHFCIQSDNLLPRTKFVTFQIHNIYLRLSHSDILTALHQFLNGLQINVIRHQRLTIDTIEELTKVFLKHNFFTYRDKLYRHSKGVPLTFPLSRLLLNIYLHHWQLPFVRRARLTSDFYGRFHDIGLLTWSSSDEDLGTCITELTKQNPDIQVTTSAGFNVHFLDVYIENRRGNLYTRMYRDSRQQLFTLPYACGHPRLIHRQWFRYALMRAARYCRSLQDFEDERLQIELTFLANGYSMDFVEYNLRRFFMRFYYTHEYGSLNPTSYTSLRSEVCRMVTKSHYYAQIQKLQEQEQKLQQYFQQQQQQQHRPTLQQESMNDPPLIELNYLFDWGNRCEFNHQFNQLWLTILKQDPIFKKYELKIQLMSKHCYSSNALLAR